jgi:riboflavin kinase/FMN adenylyltransferase
MKVYRDLDTLPKFNNAVLTIGSFDGVHSGHQKIIERVVQTAKEKKGESILITFHPHPRQVIYPKDRSLKLLNTLDEKLALLEKFGIQNVVIVSFSVEFSQISPIEYIETFLVDKFKPAAIVIGYDHRFGLNRAGNIKLLKQYESPGQFEIIEIPKQEVDNLAISSTKIREALQFGDTETANRFLKYPYILSGHVVHGHKVGGTIGYPTANLKIKEKNKLIPKEGIYAVMAHLQNKQYGGMMYIGRRPTINLSKEINVEINLFDFKGEIYDEELSVEMIQFIRDDKEFDSVESMRNRIHIDKKEAQQILKKYVDFQLSDAKITVVILNYNGQEYLESFLPQVLHSSSTSFDISVIDNNSTDSSIQYLEEWHPEVKVIRLNKNYGFAEGYNRGLIHIKSKYTVILNSDVLVTKNWLDPLVEYLDNNPDVACVQPKINSLEKRDHFEYAGASGGYMDKLGYLFCRGRIFNTLEKDLGQYDEPIEIFWACAAAMVIRTEVYNKAGGFDKDYFAHQEEADLCWRIKKAGFKIVCIPQSKVFHLGGGTLSYSSPRKTYLNFRNSLWNLVKNESLSNLIWKLPARLILDLISCIYFISKNNWPNVRSVLAADFDTTVNLIKLIRKRRFIKKYVQSNMIGFANKEGIYRGSIIWAYFIKKRQVFSSLGIDQKPLQ